MLTWERIKIGSWRAQEAEQVPTEICLEDIGPHVEIKMGAQHRLTIGRTRENKDR